MKLNPKIVAKFFTSRN